MSWSRMFLGSKRCKKTVRRCVYFRRIRTKPASTFEMTTTPTCRPFCFCFTPASPRQSFLNPQALSLGSGSVSTPFGLGAFVGFAVAPLSRDPGVVHREVRWEVRWELGFGLPKQSEVLLPSMSQLLGLG